jgi:two-component system sensor histidine kinase RegB
VKGVIDIFSDAALLYFPQQTLQVHSNVPSGEIWSDDMLLPALVNLLQNAVAANQESNQNRLELHCYEQKNQCIIELKDFGFGLSHGQLEELGHEPVKSQRGLGISVFLSNVTLSRLGGMLELENHDGGGCLARVYLNYKRMTDEAVNH